MNRSRKCAYCGSDEKLTKEHIIPDCVNERNPDQEISYLRKVDKVFNADVTIKDVCEECNNGPLSVLDSYICHLHDKFFSKYVEYKQIIEFRYDYDLLLRSLLKVLYNSSRVNKTRFKSLEKFRNYILLGENRPENIELYLKLITPYKLKFLELINAPPELKRTGKIPPEFTRISTLKTDMRKVDFPMVAFNSYYFMLVITHQDISVQKQKSIISSFEDMTDSPTNLSPKIDSTDVKGSEWDIVKAFSAQGLDSFNAFNNYKNDNWL